MSSRLAKIVTALGAVALMGGGTVLAASPAGAVPSDAVSFANANFHGYASGDEIHLGAVTVSGKSVADTEEGYSGATTDTAGLAAPVIGDDGGTTGTGLLVQPAEPASDKAFGTGAGLEVGLVAPADASADQLKLAGLAQQVAPPDSSPAVSTLLNSGSCQVVDGDTECLNLPDGLASAGALTGEGAAVFNPDVCPLGQPISYGFGDAADAELLSFADTTALAGALNGLGITVPSTGDVLTNTGDARTVSQTFLSPNGDGTYGLATEAETTIAPVSLNLFGAASVQLEIGGALNSNGTANPAVPISLTAKATGESSGAELTLAANDVVSLTLTVGPTTTTILPATSIDDLIGQGGLDIDLDPQTLVGQLSAAVNQNPVLAKIPVLGSTLGTVVATAASSLSPVTSKLPNDSLGSIALGTPVRAIDSAPSAKVSGTPTPLGAPSSTEGTTASGAFDLARVLIAPAAGGTTPSTVLANFYVGHLEASAELTAPIECTLPVIKSANPTSVQAGQSFTYNIEVPNPADLGLIDCNLDNMTVTDVITDQTGDPTFKVTSAVDTANNQAGTIDQTSDTSATVTWTGLSYTIASPPNAPIPLTITVSVPSTSSAGVITDTVTATATTSACQGGAAGSASASAAAGDNASLTGSYTLNQPSVTAAAATPAAAQPTLPFTGAMGGFWQPIGGLAALGVGAGALAMVRRSRRFRA